MASSPEPLNRSLAAEEAAARTEALYHAHQRVVRGLCVGLLRDRTEAEDAAQQVFLSAYKAILNGSEPREPAAWLATIARNECWGRARARMREPLPLADVEAAGTHPDPLAEAIRRADLGALWAAIRALPPQQRDAIVLREFGGLSYDELAAALDVSAPAVESLLFRARRRLREAYAAVTGMAWLARVGAGKAVAVGVGAAALSGGAVLVPHVLRHAPVHVRRVAAPTVVRDFSDLPPAAAPRPALPAPRTPRRRVVTAVHTRPAPTAPVSATFTPRVVPQPAPAAPAPAPTPTSAFASASAPVASAPPDATPPPSADAVVTQDGATAAAPAETETVDTTSGGSGDQSAPTTTTSSGGDGSAGTDDSSGDS